MAPLTTPPARPAGSWQPWTQAELLALALILTLAGLLRMGWPGLTEFKLDEARVYSLALQLVELKSLPLTATDMSVGLPNSPMAVYIYALPLFAWKSPLAPLLFGAALNTAAVGLAYALARRYWGPRAALLAGLLYATAPWAVLYSRKIWASNLLPAFLVGYVFSGLLAFAEARRRWVIVHLVLLSVIVQIHISSIVLAPVTLALLWRDRRRFDWRWVGYGVAGALLLEAPFLWHLATTAPAMARGTAQLAARSVTFSLDVLNLAAMVSEGTYTHALAGTSAYQAFLETVPNFNPLFWMGGLLVVVGAGRLAYAWRAGWRKREWRLPDRAGAILLLWLAMPLQSFLFHLSPIYPHYLTIFFSVAFVLSGVGLNWLLARLQQGWLRAVMLALPLVMAAAQVWQLAALLRFVGTQATPGAFGTPLGLLLGTAEAARKLDEPEIIVAAEGADPNVDFAPAVFDVLLRDQAHRFVDARTTAVFPSGPAAVILWPGSSDYGWPVAALYRDWGGGNWSSIIRLRQGEGAALLAASSGREPAVPRPREASALLANGAELLGSGRAAGGWQLWWRAPGPAPGDHYQVFAHLYDAAGHRIAQVDGSTYPAESWRAGDLVASRFALPEGGAFVRAGMYAYPSLEPVPVLDAAGNPAGQWIDFPP